MVRVIWVSFDLVLIGAILFCPGAISQSTSSNIYGQQTNYKSALSPGLIESRTSNKATANAAMNQQFTNSTRLDAFHNQTSTFMPYHQIDPTLTGSMIIDHLRTLSPTDAVFGKQTTGEKPDHQIDPTLTGSIIDHLRTLTPTDAFSGQQITGENQIDSTLTDIMIDHLPTLTPTDAFSGQQITGENQIDPTLFGMIIDHLRTLSLTDAFSGQQITGENQIDSTLTDIMIDHLPTLTPTDAFSGQQITGENQIDPTLFGMIIDHLRTLSLTDAFSGQQITGENQIDSTLTDIMIDHLPTLTPIDAFLDQQSTGEKPDHQIESTLTGTMIDHPRTLSPTDAFSGQHSTDENPDHQIDSTLTGTTAHPRTLSPTNAFSGQQTSGEKTNHQIDSTVTATNINQQTEPTSNVKPLGNTQITTVTASFENKLRASTIDFAKTPTIVNTSLQFILKPSILISNNRPSFTASYEISGYQNVPTLTVSITNQPLTSTIEEKSRHILSTPSSMIDNHIFSTTLTIKETGHEIISSYTPFVFINTRASMSTDEVMSQNIVPSRTDKITLQPTDSKLTAALSKQTSSYQTRPVLNINLPDTSISNFGVTSQQIDSIPSGKISYQLTQATPTLEVTDTSTTQRSPQPSAQKTESNEPSQSGATNRTILSSMLTYSIYQSIQLSTTFIKSNQATTSPQTDSFSVLSASSLSSINWIGRSTTSTPSKKSKVSSKSRSHGVSQSMTPTVPTSTSTTTQSPLTKSPNEDATVDVPVTLFLDRSTNTSAEKSELQTELQKQYKNVTGYIGINIYIFRLVETGISNTRRRRQVKNKLKVAYKVIIDLLTLDDEHVGTLKDAGKERLGDIIKKTTELYTNNIFKDLELEQLISTISRLKEDVQKITENFSQLLCGLGYTFNETSKMCQSRCFNITCYNKGFCILDISGNPVCQCKRDGKYVFAGDFCGTKGERLLLASEYIIAAACGSGGIIIIVAIVICFICKGRTPKDKNEKDYYIADQATLSYNHPMGLFGRQRIPSNMYFSMRDSTYNDDDRRYTVIEDLTSKRGNTYIYNPASEPSANTDTDNRSDHVYYNKSFCSEEFAIKRPHVRTERDSFRSDYNRPKIHRPDYM